MRQVDEGQMPLVPKLLTAVMEASRQVPEDQRTDVMMRAYALVYAAAENEAALRRVTARDVAPVVELVIRLAGTELDPSPQTEPERKPAYQRGRRIVGEGDPDVHPPRRDSGWRITGEGDPDVHPTRGPGRLIQDWAGQQDEPDGWDDLDEPQPPRRKKKKRS